MRRLFLAALATLSLAATIGLPASASAAEPTERARLTLTEPSADADTICVRGTSSGMTACQAGPVSA